MTEASANRTFLTKLPADALTNVLRLFSSNANRESWTRAFTPIELLTALDAIPTIAETAFDTVVDGIEWHPHVCRNQGFAEYY